MEKYCRVQRDRRAAPRHRAPSQGYSTGLMEPCGALPRKCLFTPPRVTPLTGDVSRRWWNPAGSPWGIRGDDNTPTGGVITISRDSASRPILIRCSAFSLPFSRCFHIDAMLSDLAIPQRDSGLCPRRGISKQGITCLTYQEGRRTSPVIDSDSECTR
jgi:hypothetical protein